MAAAPYWVTNMVPLGIDPLSLGPYVSVNALTGLAGTPNGTPIGTWPDESGNARNLSQGVAAQKPVYGTGLSANGGPLVRFRGTDLLPSNIGYTEPSHNPSVASGYDLLLYGNWQPSGAGKAFTVSVIFEDGTAGRPQCGYESNVNRKWFERDDLGTTEGNLFGAGYYGLMRWRFVPATATTGTLTALANGAPVLTKAYQFNPALTASWGLGDGVTLNGAPLCQVAAFCWFTRVLTAMQVRGIQAFWQRQFG